MPPERRPQAERAWPVRDARLCLLGQREQAAEFLASNADLLGLEQAADWDRVAVAAVLQFLGGSDDLAGFGCTILAEAGGYFAVLVPVAQLVAGQVGHAGTRRLIDHPALLEVSVGRLGRPGSSTREQHPREQYRRRRPVAADAAARGRRPGRSGGANRARRAAGRGGHRARSRASRVSRQGRTEPHPLDLGCQCSRPATASCRPAGATRPTNCASPASRSSNGNYTPTPRPTRRLRGSGGPTAPSSPASPPAEPRTAASRASRPMRTWRSSAPATRPPGASATPPTCWPGCMPS